MEVSMSFGKFGSRPRSMSSGLYWVGKHLESNRRLAIQNNTIERFNERWKRLQLIYDDALEKFVKPLQGFEVTPKEFQTLSNANEHARELRQHIGDHINTCSKGDLSKYATQIKKLALTSIQICHAKGVYDNISCVTYSTEQSAILFGQEIFYFFG